MSSRYRPEPRGCPSSPWKAPGKHLSRRRAPSPWMRLAGERLGKLLETVQIVHGQEFVDIRKHRSDSRGTRLEAIVTKQRIEPDEPPAGFPEPLHFTRKPRADVAVQPVGNEEHDRALRQKAPRPAPVEIGETGADACPTR